VLYAMFLAYPKSRVHFTEKFRKDLIIRISYWTTGVCPEFVDARHWKLNLGGGDVLQSTTSQTWHRGANNAASRAGGAGGSSQRMLSVDSLAGRRTSLAHRAPRPLRTLRYSPLVNRFLTSRRYSSVNLVRATRMSMTTAEERSRLMDVKHAMLLEKATAARQHCDQVVAEYDEECAEVRRQEHPDSSRRRLPKSGSRSDGKRSCDRIHTNTRIISCLYIFCSRVLGKARSENR
jgi:hypothetical protein